MTLYEMAASRSRAPTRAWLSQSNQNGGWQQRWGSNLTPMVLTTAMRNADVGYMAPMADLLDEMRETDPHLHSVLGKREWTVAAADWEVRPASVYDGESEPAKARTIRAFCTNVLLALPNLPDRFADLMGAVYYGRGVLEAVWESSGGYNYPTQLLFVHPRMIQYDQQWRMCLYSPPYIPGQGAPFGAWPGVPISDFPPGKFIVHAPRIRGGYAAKEGLGRPLAWYSMFKRWVVRDAMALAEMAGRLGRIGTFMTGANGGLRASEEDKAILESALQNWTSSGALIHPDTTSVQFQQPQKGNTIHMPLFTMFNAEMSKAVLGATLTTEAGVNGARSLGQVHDQQGRMIAKYDASTLAETIRRYLLAPLVALNFGPDEAVPRFAFEVEPQDSLDTLATRLKNLCDMGVEMSQDWVRDQFGILDPSSDDKLVSRAVPAASIPWPYSAGAIAPMPSLPAPPTAQAGDAVPSAPSAMVEQGDSGDGGGDE